LGTSPYVPVRYSLDDGKTDAMRSYVQAAIAELCPEIDKLVVLMTVEAQEKHGKALTAELGSVRSNLVLEPRRIPDGKSEDQLWTLYEVMGQVLEANRRKVVFDITHGFRSLPAAGVLALSFYQQVFDFRPERLLYGAFDAVADESGQPPSLAKHHTPANALRALSEQERGRYTAPILDLTPMFALPAWAQAVSEWKRTGRAKGIIEQTTPYIELLSRRLREKTPRALRTLPKALAQLDNAVALLRHDKFAQQADSLLVCLANAHQQLEGHPQLRPLVTLLGSMQGHALRLRVDNVDPNSANNPYLRNQLAVAQELMQTGRIVEAFSLLREALCSVAVRLAVRAGLEANPTDPSSRDECSRTISAHCKATQYAVENALWKEQLERSLPTESPLARAFRGAFQLVYRHRNKLDHCWTGSHAEEAFNMGVAHSISTDLEKACSQFGELLDLLEEATPIFLNLSNHPVSSWSETQIAAARCLGFGEPTEFAEEMPVVAPTATADETDALAQSLVTKAVAQQAGAAFVATDFTLTFALVQRLQCAGIRCFAATTQREVSERLKPDASVERTSTFRFVAWREYPRLQTGQPQD
jgi:CRISPR-associated DxTHG motif protein